MIDRRRFLGVSASCSAHLAFMAVGASPGLRRFLVPDQQRDKGTGRQTTRVVDDRSIDHAVQSRENHLIGA